MIRFQALQTDAGSFPFPYQRHNSKEDWVIDLPSTAEEYTARLGKSTRNNIKYDVRRLSRVFPDHSLRFYTGAEIDEAHVRTIVELSDARISAKKKRFSIDDEETERIIRFAKEGGLVSVLHIDGRLCAGMICQIVGSAYMVEVIAHDPAYNEFRLGALCYYRTICEAIARGATTMYMGGGREPYKARFLGVRQDMDRLELYRSHASVVLNPFRVAKTAVEGGIRKAKIWLLAREKSALTRTVFLGLILARRLRERLK
nr:GNAT family N-acetyltransferase [Azospirillum soli]